MGQSYKFLKEQAIIEWNIIFFIKYLKLKNFYNDEWNACNVTVGKDFVCGLLKMHKGSSLIPKLLKSETSLRNERLFIAVIFAQI